ncbi:MAG TPA: RHS repeat-associated core domain-containing protein [Polyangiaceae bacterium]|jgi:RHS repeat-associated protein
MTIQQGLALAALSSFIVLAPRAARADAPPPPPFVAGQTDFGGSPTLAKSSTQGVPASLATVDLSTGEARAGFSFDLPTARGAAQPALSLSYSSAAGVGFAGMGWTLNLPTIERRGAAGAPRFDSDVLGTSPDQSSDRYVFDGLPLVPICTLAEGGACRAAGLASDESFPDSLAGWTYFRGEIDDGQRFFYSPDGQTWVVQTKPGVTATFGVITDTLAGGAIAVERGHEPLAPTSIGGTSALTAPLYPVYRWNLAKQTDASGNAVYYGWSHLQVDPTSGVDPTLDQGREYLTDIYDTLAPGVVGGISGPSAGAAPFAHHVHLRWNLDGGLPSFLAQSPSWQTPPAFFLDHVDVTSSPLSGGTRQLVRRYWLHYGAFGTDFSASQLAEIDLEGTCNGLAENASGLLPNSTGCPRLPALALTYTASQPTLTAGGAGTWTQVTPYRPYTPQPPYYLVDSTGISIPGLISATGVTLVPNPNGQGGPLAATAADLLPSAGGPSRFALGDWLGDGQVEWLWFNIGPSDQPTNANMYEVYTSAGSTSPFGLVGLGPFNLPDYLAQNMPHGFEPDFQTGRAMDIDGDGLTDMGIVPEGTTSGTDLRGYFTTRNALGQINPVAQWSATPTCGSNSLWGDIRSFYKGAAQRVLADVDGDGLVDVVVLENVQPFVSDESSVFGKAIAHVFKNRGDGRFGGGGTDVPTGCNANYAYDSYDIPIGTGGGIDNVTFVSPATSMHDVNGDGLADFVWIDVNGLHVILQEWNPTFASYGFDGVHVLLESADTSTLGCKQTANAPTGDNPPRYNVNDTLVQFADMNASGVDDIITYVCGTLSWFSLDSTTRNEPPFPVRPGLLQTISNGVGLKTTLTYENYLDLLPAPGAAPWPVGTPTLKPLPIPLALVSTMEATNGLSGPGARDSVTNYSYGLPVYDARDRVFVGFRTVSTTQAGDGSGPGLDTVTHFANGTYPVSPGQGAPPSADYGYRIQRGLPAVIEQRNDSTHATESTTVNTYSYETLFQGTDGRVVRQVYLSQVDQYAWDETLQQSTATAPPVLQDVSSPAQHTYDLSVSGIDVPTMAGHTRKRFHLTPQGNEDRVIDYGNPDGASPDQPIEISSVWMVPDNSQTGWNYRLTQTLTAYADGSGHLISPLREADYTYDYRGLPQTVASPLSGTLPLLRANPGGATAPTPNDASQDTSAPETLLTLTYDSQFGNLIQVTGPNPAGPTQQCTQINYDSAFSQLPVRTTQFRGGCGGIPLTTSMAYDRGLERVTMEISPSNEVYSATYDAFGRLQTARAPDAETPLHPDPNPTVMIDYSKFDPPQPPIDPTSPPAPLPTFLVRVLGVNRNVGAEGQPTYASRWKYFDGSGRQLVTVQQSENAGQWVVQGATAVGGSTGRLTQAWQPFFASLANGAGYDIQVAPASTVPSATATYNALSEITSKTDELGRVSKVTYLPAVFSQQVFDAAQVVAIDHKGSTTIKYDGHGRLASTTAAIANPQTDSIVTALAYLATGEVTMVTKSDSATSAPFVRSMTYDTRGRLVANTEPNTSFRTLVLAGEISTSPHNWRYAYNDSGQLVGTSDARGCGENMQYDDLGRIIGEDYSPCESYQPAYSAGNYVTGEGLEAFYKYDVPETSFTHAVFYRGHLTAAYDRGQNTRLQLDGRGRVTEIDRRLGGSLSFYGIAGDYSSHVFSRQFHYDEANHVVTATTGADIPDLTAAGSSMTTAFTVRDGVSALQMPYSGGQLLGKRTFDASNNVLSESYGSSTTPGPSQALRYYPNETLKELVTDGPLLLGGPGKAGASQAVIQDLMLSYDQVDNPTGINDVSPTAWPAGILPAKHTAKYDDLYRLTSVTTTYGGNGGTDAFSLPYQSEVLAGSLAFPATVVPATAGPQSGPTRVQNQTFVYDFLDNVHTSTDDKTDVPDRSFGQGHYGASSLVGSFPNHFVSSSSPNGAGVTASYDQAGNTTGMTVTYATLPDGTCSNGATPPCMSTYLYAWDEIGRLLYSVRYDGAVDLDGGIAPPANVEFTYTYDASGARVARRADIAQTDGPRETSFSVTVFPSLRLENTRLDASGDYELSDETEVVYLQDGAGATYGRAFYAPSNDPAAAGTGAVHVYLEFSDHLGSTSAVLDFDTGAIVEKSSYLAYGAVDADYRPTGFREPYRYTGHHDDSEVGLSYFGARYYIPTLARWASPDPMTIHALGSSLNPYSFVRGSPLGNIDPFGLDPEQDQSAPPTSDESSTTAQSGWNFAGFGGGAGGGTFPVGPSIRGQRTPFIFQQWNLAFQLQQPTLLAGWSAQSPPSASGWKGAANAWIDFLADSYNLTLGPTAYLVSFAKVIPRFDVGSDINAADAYRATHAFISAASMILPGGLEAGGPAIQATIEKAGVDAAEETAAAAAKYITSTPQSAIALSKQLASEAQLSEMTARAGSSIAGPGTATVFRDAARVAQTYGGKAIDWAKMTSSAFHAADGTIFATHWVENVLTGQQVEFKVVIDIFGGP